MDTGRALPLSSPRARPGGRFRREADRPGRLRRDGRDRRPGRRRVPRRSDAQAAAEVVAAARDREVERIVVGLPVRPDGGGESAFAARTRSFARKLAEVSGLPVDLHDEALTRPVPPRAPSATRASRGSGGPRPSTPRPPPSFFATGSPRAPAGARREPAPPARGRPPPAPRRRRAPRGRWRRSSWSGARTRVTRAIRPSSRSRPGPPPGRSSRRSSGKGS